MQMNALRSANFAKLSSNSATSDEYWLTSMSAGTPGGYCLSQIRSMGLSLESSEFVCACIPKDVRDGFYFRQYGHAAEYGKRMRVIDASDARPQAGLTPQNPFESTGRLRRSTGRLGFRLGLCCGRLGLLWRCRRGLLRGLGGGVRLCRGMLHLRLGRGGCRGLRGLPGLR